MNTLAITDYVVSDKVLKVYLNHIECNASC